MGVCICAWPLPALTWEGSLFLPIYAVMQVNVEGGREPPHPTVTSLCLIPLCLLHVLIVQYKNDLTQHSLYMGFTFDIINSYQPLSCVHMCSEVHTADPGVVFTDALQFFLKCRSNHVSTVDVSSHNVVTHVKYLLDGEQQFPRQDIPNCAKVFFRELQNVTEAPLGCGPSPIASWCHGVGSKIDVLVWQCGILGGGLQRFPVINFGWG